MNSTNQHWTAAQLARALGEKRQAMQRLLAGIPPSGQVIVKGSAAAGWTISALPVDLQKRLAAAAQRRGCRNEEHLLSAAVEHWTPPIPLANIGQEHLDKAVKLRDALASTLARINDLSTSEADLCSAGAAEFKRVFGYSISARQLRRIVDRTVRRDGGAQDWTRVDLYLDETAFARSTAKPAAAREQYRHRELDKTVLHLENKAEPTCGDRADLFNAAFQHYERLTADLGESPESRKTRRVIKGSLIFYLFKAVPALSKSESSLRRIFEMKLQAWRDGGHTSDALQDRRPLDSGNFRKQDFKEDLKKIRNLAIQLDGSESLAHRMLREQGQLSKEFCETYSYDVRHNKSAVPKSVRDAITPEVNMVLPLRRGPWQARMRGPYTPRDWSEVKPGDYFSADDTNLNHYYKVRLPNGLWAILRGEFLLMTDLATGYPLECLQIPGAYHGEHCKILSLQVHDKVGLPDEGYYFEMGRWASKIVAGEGGKGTRLHRRETENGLAAMGLRIAVRHATTPRAKPIEGLLHILQDRMRCIQNFVGFNERTENFERVQVLISRARRGDEEALAQFPTAQEWMAKIRQVLGEFANDPQNGKMLNGLSPAEAWAQHIREHPLRKLPNEARYILSTHQKKVTVRQEGILLTIRGKKHLYYNEHTGPLIGREVLAFYNIELPELLTVCDMDRQNYFSVRRVELPAMTATPEQFAEVNRLRKAHMAPAQAIFGELRHEVVSSITRDNEHTAEEKELGRFHNEEVEKATAEKTKTTRKLRKLQVKAAAAGIELPGQVRDPDDAAEAIDRREYFLKRLREKEQQETASEKTQ